MANPTTSGREVALFKLDRLCVPLFVLAVICLSICKSSAQTTGNASTHNSGNVTVHANARDTYDLLDPTTNITRKDLVLLRAARNVRRGETTLAVGAAMTGLVNAQKSNRAGKFGYLMRHPTSNNQAGQSASEAVLHSAQLRVTGTAGSWITGHTEFLYDPEQSFGQGTITALTRNQIQLRHGFVPLGNLKKSPVYASLGKMAVPFGLMDTVNPFTASTVWHAFGGLAYGGRIGYQSKGLGVSFMAVQGGAQFRAAHAPVEGTAIPSRTNNFSVDVKYTIGDVIRTLTDQEVTNRALVGASYIHGSAYCQGFPAVHFQSCDERNPAYDFYGHLNLSQLTIQGEFAKTTDLWPGTFNPALPQFAAHKVSSFAFGGKFRAMADARPVDVSMEFSRFTAGPTGAPWDDQD